MTDRELENKLKSQDVEVPSSINPQNIEALLGSMSQEERKKRSESSDIPAENTNEFGQMIQGFSDVGNELYTNVEHMKNSTESINRTIEDTADNLSGIALKAGNVSESIKDIETQALKSSEVSDALYSEVDKFKLD